MRMRLACRIGFFGVLAVVIGGSLVPTSWLGQSIINHDKLTHLAGYFVLAMLMALGWPRWRGVALVGLPLVGLALEVSQTMTPGRGFSWADVVANAAGIGLAVTLSAALTRWLGLEQKSR